MENQTERVAHRAGPRGSSAPTPIRGLGPVADVVRLGPVAAAPNNLVDN
jgi:hypothetical protein